MLMLRLQIGRAPSALAPVLLCLLLAAPAPASAEESDKNDRVTLRNGNVIDGEVKLAGKAATEDELTAILNTELAKE